MHVFNVQSETITGKAIVLQYRLHRAECGEVVLEIISESRIGGKSAGKLHYQFNVVEDLSILNKKPNVVEAVLRRLVKKPTKELEHVPEMKEFMASMKLANLKLITGAGDEMRTYEFKAKVPHTLSLVFDLESVALEFVNTAHAMSK
jgi:hypothetical protein